VRSTSRSRTPRGFTLIELIVVIAIIATLAAMVAPSIFSNVSDARSSAAKAQIQVLSLALDAYRLDVFLYPTSEAGLAVLRTAPLEPLTRAQWRGPYLRQEVPVDPWGRPYLYRSPGAVNPESFDLYTLGRDGQPGGSGEDADVTSWNGTVSR
jgi:general secretion pathway protein G